ncbi:hypothetical protein BM536_011085 [Streptomyces phaeoluteigriseus]|uniref:Uncharacterized protein n=1 Tax=Streptomyces phaeoluteigriseus TaxID=114686 RepID=A0A1V6MUZ9_9ACTN|nr:hypothetical protein BM536_011085 [Streptomyces phaeoluteigriseus]
MTASIGAWAAARIARFRVMSGAVAAMQSVFMLRVFLRRAGIEGVDEEDVASRLNECRGGRPDVWEH